MEVRTHKPSHTRTHTALIAVVAFRVMMKELEVYPTWRPTENLLFSGLSFFLISCPSFTAFISAFRSTLWIHPISLHLILVT